MYKLAKWAFNRGVMAERNRIKKLIAENRQARPDKVIGDRETKDNFFERQLWNAVNHELSKLTDSHWGKTYEVQQPIPRIDEEL